MTEIVELSDLEIEAVGGGSFHLAAAGSPAPNPWLQPYAGPLAGGFVYR